MIDSNNFTGPNPPEWRNGASVAYYKDKLYYLGGKVSNFKDNLYYLGAWDSREHQHTNRVDVRRSNENP